MFRWVARWRWGRAAHPPAFGGQRASRRLGGGGPFASTTSSSLMSSQLALLSSLRAPSPSSAWPCGRPTFGV
eukprot:12551210-Heterocapsa_arctica.AAC.1